MLKQVKSSPSMTLYDEILMIIQDSPPSEISPLVIKVAAFDLDKNGKKEYLVTMEGFDMCGSHGCSLDIYKDNGKYQINLVDYLELVKLDQKGVITSKGKKILFKKAY